MIDIILIKDVVNPVLAHRAHPTLTFSIAHSEGPSIPVKPVERMDVSADIKMGV